MKSLFLAPHTRARHLLPLALMPWAAPLLPAQIVHDLESKAAAGQPQAQFELAKRFELGLGVSQNFRKAAQWYRQAADQDLADAQYHLSRLYREGDGVAKNEERALHWLRLAARQDHPLAQNKLGVCYQFGRNVPQDPVEAYKWFLLAADSNRSVCPKANRDLLASQLTSDQIARAHERASVHVTQVRSK